MRSNLQKKVLTVRDKHGTHRQTYYVADQEHPAQRPGHTVATVAKPRDVASVHYGMLWAGKANKGVDEALSAIAKTHDVPSNLFRVKIRVVGSLEGSNGIYDFSKGPSSNQIHVSKYAKQPAATMAHEYGHFLDHHLFGSGKPRLSSLGTQDSKNSKVQAELKALKTAMYSSDAVQSLVKRHNEHVKEKDHVGKQYTGYLLEPAEIFARAYAQWIGVRSSPIVHRQVKEQGATWRDYGYQAQWEDRDFEPIAREFDRLFARRGLRNGRR